MDTIRRRTARPLAAAALLAAALCTSPARAGDTGGAAGGPERLVGVLTQQAHMVCDGTPKPRWVEPWWEIGFVRVDPAPGVDLAPYEGKMVVVEGEARHVHAPQPTLVHTGPCVTAQMRSDWVEGPKGTRVRRGRSPDLPGFRAEAVRAFDGLTVRAVGDDELEVALQNPFPAPLAPVTIAIHYEGCYGKPGTTTRRTTFSKIAPGQTLTARFPRFDEKDPRPKGRRVHRAAQVGVRAPTGAVAWDLDVSLHAFPGVPVDCPRPGSEPRPHRQRRAQEPQEETK